MAAIDDTLEWLDLLLEERGDARVSDLDQWKEFHQARLKFDSAWGQVRLVAPTKIANYASKAGFALYYFDRDARQLSVDEARALRDGNQFLSWEEAHSFVTAARKDLKVESWTHAVRRRRASHES